MRSVTSKFLVLLLPLAMVAAGCAQTETEPEDTPEASPAAGVEISGSFEITGTVEGVETDDTPDDIDIEQVPPASPLPTDGGTLPEPGHLEIEVTTPDEDLDVSCAIEVGDTIDVYWTTQTRFVPETIVEGDDWEDGFNDQEVTVEGRYIRPADFGDDEGLIGFTPVPGGATEPDVSPEPAQATDAGQGAGSGASGSQPDDPLSTAGGGTCTFIADLVHVGAETRPRSSPQDGTSPSPTTRPTGRPGETPGGMSQ